MGRRLFRRPADALVHDDAVIFRQADFFFKGVLIYHGADDGGEAAGGAVEVDVLVGGAHVILAAAVIHAGVEQVERGCFDKILAFAERDEVFVVHFGELVSRAIVFPGAGGGEDKELHVLQAARGGNGALAVRVLSPGNPQNFGQSLVIDSAGGVVTAGGVALGNGLHERHAAGHRGSGQFFGFSGTPCRQKGSGQ